MPLKICILGLDSAASEVIFGDDRFSNIRRLMDLGIFGRLESTVPPGPVPAWMCMSTSQDSGSLGLYGYRNRRNHSYDSLDIASSTSTKPFALWDQLAVQGKKSILLGVPPNFPPRQVNGISIGCFLTPDPAKVEFTSPATLKPKLQQLVGEYPVDVSDDCRSRRDRLRDEILTMSRKHWTTLKWLITEEEWDYVHFLDIGLDRLHRGFWNCFDPSHVEYEAGNLYESVIPDYYQWLDQQIGEVVELLDADTILLLISCCGTQRVDGAIALNQWLVDEGLLVLHEYPDRITAFDKLNVNWAKTKVWSEGGDYTQVFFNVQGREPQGVIPASQYNVFQSEMKARFEALLDDKGLPLNSVIFKPREVYSETHNVAPDLIVYLAGMRWRSVASVGHHGHYLRGDDAGPDSCSHSQNGMFVLVAPNCPITGEFEGARLLDIAPTLLDLGGYDIPASMQGRSLVAGIQQQTSPPKSMPEDDQMILERLAGLGYV